MNIIELAREAGFTELEFFGNKVGTNVTECLERFRALVLEEAAKVCDDIRSPLGYSTEKEDWIRGTDDCARAIRALKGAKE